MCTGTTWMQTSKFFEVQIGAGQQVCAKCIHRNELGHLWVSPYWQGNGWHSTCLNSGWFLGELLYIMGFRAYYKIYLESIPKNDKSCYQNLSYTGGSFLACDPFKQRHVFGTWGVQPNIDFVWYFREYAYWFSCRELDKNIDDPLIYVCYRWATTSS